MGRLKFDESELEAVMVSLRASLFYSLVALRVEDPQVVGVREADFLSMCRAWIIQSGGASMRA